MKQKLLFTLVCTCALAPGAATAAPPRQIPDTTVYDQAGRKLSFYTDLVKGKTVAIDFIFTTCTTICQPLTARFRQVQKTLGERVGRDVRLISITVDPATDTPERLASFAATFDAGPGWSFVTGTKSDIDRLLTALGVATGDKADHTPMVLVGNEAAHFWTFTYGLSPTGQLTDVIREAAHKPVPVQANPVVGATDHSPTAASRRYFSDTQLLTQDGQSVRFFSDLLDGKVVLINFAFTTCTDACAPMTANLALVQQYLGGQLGKNVHMISISVDPEMDTPAALKEYAGRFHAQPGWYFLTGTRNNVDVILRKLGGWSEDKNDHSTVLLIGNVPKGEWVKASALMKPAEIAKVVAGMQ